MALGTRTKLQLEILTINVISDIVYFREIMLESVFSRDYVRELAKREWNNSLDSDLWRWQR